MSWDSLCGFGPSNSSTLKACLQAIRSSNSSIDISLQRSPLGPKMLAALTQAINENPTVGALNLTKAKIKDWNSLPQLFEALAPCLRVVVWEVAWILAATQHRASSPVHACPPPVSRPCIPPPVSLSMHPSACFPVHAYPPPFPLSMHAPSNCCAVANWYF